VKNVIIVTGLIILTIKWNVNQIVKLMVKKFTIKKKPHIDNVKNVKNHVENVPMNTSVNLVYSTNY